MTIIGSQPTLSRDRTCTLAIAHTVPRLARRSLAPGRVLRGLRHVAACAHNTHATVTLYSKLPHKVRMRLKMQHACLRLPCHCGTCKLCIALNLQLNRRQFTLVREANKHSKYGRDNDYVQKHKTQKQYTLALPTAQNIPGIALATVVVLLTL